MTPEQFRTLLLKEVGTQLCWAVINLNQKGNKTPADKNEYVDNIVGADGTILYCITHDSQWLEVMQQRYDETHEFYGDDVDFQCPMAILSLKQDDLADDELVKQRIRNAMITYAESINLNHLPRLSWKRRKVA